MSKQPAPTLSDLASELHAKLAAIQNLRKMLPHLQQIVAEHPDLAPFVRQAIEDPSTPVEVAEQPKMVLKTHTYYGVEEGTYARLPEVEISGSGPPLVRSNFQKVVNFFESRNGEPATLGEIALATGIPDSSVRNVVYVNKPGAFIQVDHPEKPGKHWRLRTENDPPPDSSLGKKAAEAVGRMVDATKSLLS